MITVKEEIKRFAPKPEKKKTEEDNTFRSSVIINRKCFKQNSVLSENSQPSPERTNNE